MANKNDTGIVGIARGISGRLEQMEETLSELESDGRKLQETMPGTLEKIVGLEKTVEDAETKLEGLRTERHQLQQKYVGATFSEDTQAQQRIIEERRELDQRISALTHKRDTAASNGNKLRSSLDTRISDAKEALEGMEMPDLKDLMDALRGQMDALEKRVEAASRLYETRDEREAREAAQRTAEARQRAADRQEIVNRRNTLGRLLNSVSEFGAPHLGHRAWVEYLENHNIDTRTESTGETTFIGPDDTGRRTTLDAQSIVSDVKAEYAKCQEELGEPMPDESSPQRQPRMGRPIYASVM